MDVELVVTYIDIAPMSMISYWENTYHVKLEDIFSHHHIRRNSLIHFESIGSVRARVIHYAPKQGYDVKFLAATKSILPMYSKVRISLISVLSNEDYRKLSVELGKPDSLRMINEVSPLES